MKATSVLRPNPRNSDFESSWTVSGGEDEDRLDRLLLVTFKQESHLNCTFSYNNQEHAIMVKEEEPMSPATMVINGLKVRVVILLYMKLEDSRVHV